MEMTTALRILIVFVALSSTEAGDPLTAQLTKSLAALDLGDSDLTTSYCKAEGKKCETAAHNERFATTIDQMVARCNRDLECYGILFDDERNAYFHKERCTVDKLVDKENHTELYRLEKDESCPEGYEKHFRPKAIYSNSFCQINNKACPDHSIYKSPLAILDFLKCLGKCAKITTCGAVDYQAGVKRPCEPLNHQCSDDELVDAPGYTNYVRLEKGVTTCPDNSEAVSEPAPPATPAPQVATAPPATPAPQVATAPPAPVVKEIEKGPLCNKKSYDYCIRSERDCYGHDIRSFRATTLQKCKEECDKDCRCRSIQFKDYCFLKDYVCTASELRYDAGGNYVKRVEGEKGCGPLCNKKSYDYCRRSRKDCWGHDIRAFTAPNLQKCKEECDKECRCRSIQYKDYCWLKDYVCTASELRYDAGGNYDVKRVVGERACPLVE